MEHPSTQHLRITIDGSTSVSALLRVPDQAWVGYVFGHGAGAGMDHPFMANFANGLAERGIATLRYQFPFMEQGSKRPDAPQVAHAAVRAAVAEAKQRLPGLPLLVGGKSFGGRMTSQAQALSPMPGVAGTNGVGEIWATALSMGTDLGRGDPPPVAREGVQSLGFSRHRADCGMNTLAADSPRPFRDPRRVP